MKAWNTPVLNSLSVIVIVASVFAFVINGCVASFFHGFHSFFQSFSFPLVDVNTRFSTKPSWSACLTISWFTSTVTCKVYASCVCWSLILRLTRNFWFPSWMFPRSVYVPLCSHRLMSPTSLYVTTSPFSVLVCTLPFRFGGFGTNICLSHSCFLCQWCSFHSGFIKNGWCLVTVYLELLVSFGKLCLFLRLALLFSLHRLYYPLV